MWHCFLLLSTRPGYMAGWVEAESWCWWVEGDYYLVVVLPAFTRPEASWNRTRQKRKRNQSRKMVSNLTRKMLKIKQADGRPSVNLCGIRRRRGTNIPHPSGASPLPPPVTIQTLQPQLHCYFQPTRVPLYPSASWVQQGRLTPGSPADCWEKHGQELTWVGQRSWETYGWMETATVMTVLLYDFSCQFV